MTNSLPADLAQFVQTELAAGHYPSVEAMVCDGLRLLQHHQGRLEELRREILPALERLDRGEGIELEQHELRGWLDGILAEVKAQMDAERKTA